jgi:cytochrome P450 family 135
LQVGMAQPAPARRLPSVRGSTFLGTLQLGLNPEGYLAKAQRRYGDVFAMRILGQRWVALAHPEAIREVFSYGSEALDAGEANSTLRVVIGTRNLVLLDGEEHLHRRRMVLPHFHGERMRSYEEVIRHAILEDIASWPIGESVAVQARMQALTVGVILRCVFGVREEEGRIEPLKDALLGMIESISDIRRVMFWMLLGPDRAGKVPSFRRLLGRVDRALFAEIARRRTMADLEQREDILSLLIQARDEDGECLSDRELRDELMTLLLAGHETTSTLIAWAVHELVRDQPSQDRLAAEPGAFTDAVITETLRLHPPVLFLKRRLREPMSIAGYELPAGTNLLPLMVLVQRRADLYPDPSSFDPTRFLQAKPPAGGWFPFGGSVRRCVGASFAQFEAKIVLEEMTRAFRLRPVEERPEGTRRQGVVCVPSKGARVIAESR